MASNDPTDTGGLFIGRRPGTAPVRYREQPVLAQPAAPARRRAGWPTSCSPSRSLLCLSLLGPQPAAWMWIGSQVEYLTGFVTTGISTIMVGCLASLFLTLALGKRVDHAWKLVRRAAGHRQEQGALERIFAHQRGAGARAVHDLVPRDRGPGAEPRAHQLVGLLDYYRQFEEVDERELNKERRARRDRERKLALERVDEIDLSGTEWPDLPNSEVMNASIYTARGRVNGYPDRHAAAHPGGAGRPPRTWSAERIVLGNGAAELLQAAAMALLGAGRRAGHAMALVSRSTR